MGKNTVPPVLHDDDDIFHTLDIQHHDRPDRHQFGISFPAPNQPAFHPGTSPIPARSDHEHPPAEPLILKFFHSNVLTVSISPADWFESTDTFLIAYRAFRKVHGSTAITFSIYNFTTVVRTGSFAATSNDTADAWTSAATPIPYTRREKVSVGLSGFTPPTTSADFSIQLLFEVQ